MAARHSSLVSDAVLEYLENSGVDIKQSGNRGGSYTNTVTVDKSHKTEGTYIRANVVNYIKNPSEKRIAVPDQLQSASSSSSPQLDIRERVRYLATYFRCSSVLFLTLFLMSVLLTLFLFLMRNTVLGQIPQPWNKDLASSSSVVEEQNTPPPECRLEIRGRSTTTVTIDTYNIATDGQRKSIRWECSENHEIDIYRWQRIVATINVSKNELSPKTYYAAYLVFKTTTNSKGLEAKMLASVANGQMQRTKFVSLHPSTSGPPMKDVGLPVQRSDGWMELELGQFFCEDNTIDTEVKVTLMDLLDNQYDKTGLIMARIAIVPVLLAARRLDIEHSDKSQYWTWHVPKNDSRLTSEVAQLLEVYFFYIEARIRLIASTFTQDETIYAAYLIFKTVDIHSGLNAELVALVSTNERSYILSSRTVCLYPTKQTNLKNGLVRLPTRRPDGWMELKLGQFFFGYNTRNQELFVTLKDPLNEERQVSPKTGLVVAGIELRRPSNEEPPE